MFPRAVWNLGSSNVATGGQRSWIISYARCVNNVVEVYVKFKIKQQNNLEAIANADPCLNCCKTIVADYPLGGAASLLFTGGRIVFVVLELFA